MRENIPICFLYVIRIEGMRIYSPDFILVAPRLLQNSLLKKVTLQDVIIVSAH